MFADGHQILGQFLIWIKQDVFDTKTAKGELMKHIKTAKSQGSVDDTKWPFRCWDVDVIELYKILIETSASYWNKDVYKLAFSMIVSFPKFERYSQHINPRTPFTEFCSIIRSFYDSGNPSQQALRDIRRTMLSISPFVEEQCGAGNNVDFYCKFDSLLRDVTAMQNDDAINAGKSRTNRDKEIEKFASFWIFDSALATYCGQGAYNLDEFQKNTLLSFSEFALERLYDVIKMPSVSGRNREKILTFIDDYLSRIYPKYVKGNDVYEHEYVKIESEKRDLIWEEKPQQGVTFAMLSFIKLLSDMKQLLHADDPDIEEIRTLARFACFWFMHPDFKLNVDHTYNEFLGGIKYSIEHPSTLEKLLNAVKVYKGKYCDADASTKVAKRFCKVRDLLTDLETYFATIRPNSIKTRPKIKIINPATDYSKVLELDSTVGRIFTNIESLEIGQKRLENSLTNMKSSLAAHFYQLATFDEGKAGNDVIYLEDKLRYFEGRIRNVGIDEKLGKLFSYALGANIAELANLAVKLAAAVASNSNPLKWITTGGGATEIMDRVDDLAQASVNSVRLATIKNDILPELVKKADKLNKANKKNAAIHKKLSKAYHDLKNKKEIDINEVQTIFLENYGSYDPVYYKIDITEYTALLEKVIEKLCDILYGGGTTAAAVVEGIGASKSICLRIQIDAEVIGAIHEEMYDFQYDFMDAMADTIRALVARHSAKNIGDVPALDDSVLLKIYVHRIKLQSKQHVLVALKDVCNVLEYKNGGVPTAHCKDALKNQKFANIRSVLANPVVNCPADQITMIDAHIPAQVNHQKRKLKPGIIDLTQLYAGNIVRFSIPFSNTIDYVHQFISPILPVHKDVALYLRRVELFLPKMSNETHDVEVSFMQSGSVSILQGSHTQRYSFSKENVFTLTYGENKQTCPNGFIHSMYPKLCEPHPTDVCVSSYGVISEDELAPPLFNTIWQIQAFLPHGLTPPQPSPDSVFYLKAKMEICVKNPKGIDLVTTKRQKSVKNKSENPCCGKKSYWYIDPGSSDNQARCRKCPPNSTPNLGGLFCGIDP